MGGVNMILLDLDDEYGQIAKIRLALGLKAQIYAILEYRVGGGKY